MAPGQFREVRQLKADRDGRGRRRTAVLAPGVRPVHPDDCASIAMIGSIQDYTKLMTVSLLVRGGGVLAFALSGWRGVKEAHA